MTESTNKGTARRQLEIVGEHIRSVRAEHRFSQVGFAVRAGFSGAYYSAIERGKLNFSVINLLRIARALGVEVGALFPPISELQGPEGDIAVEEATEREDRIAEARRSYELAATVEVEERGEGGEGGEGEGAIEGQAQTLLLISAGAAARIIGVNRRTIERWVQKGLLTPAAHVEDQGGKLYSVFRPEDIRLIAERQWSNGTT